MRGQDFGNPFSATFAGTVSSIAIQAGTTGRVYFVTDISGTSDLAGQKIEVRNGTAALWQDRIICPTGTSSGVYQHVFSTPLVTTPGSSVSVYVGSATTVSFANIAGYFLP